MSWRRHRPSVDAPPPLDLPDDLGSGAEARERALDRLQIVVADEQATMWQRVLDRIVQENHIREYLREAHGGN